MHPVKITAIDQVTHNVKRFRMEKPEGFHFNPGQAIEMALAKTGWEKEKHPFTLTSLNSDPFLEFTIKIYPIVDKEKQSGLTNELGGVAVGDEVRISDPFGTISYKGAGVFIAGGAGITPFIAIFRQLKKDGKLEGNKLIFSNKKRNDVILEEELRSYLGDRLILVFTQDGDQRIDKDFLQKNITNFDQYFYVCGPKSLVHETVDNLKSLGVSEEKIIIES